VSETLPLHCKDVIRVKDAQTRKLKVRVER